jgi:hypothetical protein
MILSASRPLLAALGVLAGLLLLRLGPAAAQDAPGMVLSTADYVYGQTMRFKLAAADIGPIESITLFFRVGVSPDAYSVDVPIDGASDASVAAGEPLEASYALDLTQTRLPPFSPVTYWWRIERANAEALLVPEQVISYVDDQFTWNQLVETDEVGGGSVRVHWTGEGEALGRQAADLVYEMLPRLSRLMPLDHILPFDVYLYPSTADLGAALRLAGRDYQPGQTYPDLGVILTTVVNRETAEAELRDGLSRGLADLLLYQTMGQTAHQLPPWVSRGLAGVARGRSDAVLDGALRSAVAAETTLPLADLCAGATVDTDLAAAQSEALVSFIAATYGDAAVRELVAALAGGADCETAVRGATGLTPAQLDAAWLRARRGGETGRNVAEMAVWGVLLMAGFGFAALLILRPGRK